MNYRLALLPLTLAALLSGCGGPSGGSSDAGSTNAPLANAPGNTPGEAGPGGHAMGHSQMPSMARLHELSGPAFDAAFASAMIEHHQGAVEMSEEALKAAKRDEVKEVARKIIADQKKEIAQMTAWVKEWTGKEPDPEFRNLMKTDMQPMMDAFKKECQTDCDRAFLIHMKAHHQAAVEMAQMAVEKAEHPELKELAGGMIASQSQEMAEFERLLKEWYPDAATSPAPTGH